MTKFIITARNDDGRQITGTLNGHEYNILEELRDQITTQLEQWDQEAAEIN